jgi:hypothetical protein
MIQIRDIQRALAEAGDAARTSAMSDFRSAGGSLDRWQRSEQLAMVVALTRAEDALEAQTAGRMTAGREAIQAVRRRLEDSLGVKPRRTSVPTGAPKKAEARS